MVQSFNHVNLVVSDIDAACAFFVDQLGFTAGREQILEGDWASKLNDLPNVKARYIPLTVGSSPTKIELLSFITPASIPNQDEPQPNLNGFRHVGLVVEDLEAEMARLEKQGIKFLSAPQKPPDFGVSTVYFLGPENVLIQLIQPIASRQAVRQADRPGRLRNRWWKRLVG